MKLLLLVICWCILLALCWPLALIALVLSPLVWLLALPFMLAGAVFGVTFSALLALIAALLFLPARLLGLRR